MSTTIKSAVSGKRLVIDGRGLIYLGIFDAPDAAIKVPRADFLAAVAAECGVIVIDRADLPEVLPCMTAGEYVAGRLITSGVESAEDARESAREWLALADYLDAHPPVPPVDEAKVEALASDLFDARWPGQPWNQRAVAQKDDYRRQARALIAAGWSK